MHALMNVDTIIDSTAHTIWAMSQGKKIDDAVPEICIELKKMLDSICYFRNDEMRMQAYQQYVAANKDTHLTYSEWQLWEKRFNMIHCHADPK